MLDTPRTLDELLDDLPDEELRALEVGIRNEFTRLQVQLTLVESALAKRRRKRSRRASSGSSAAPSRGLKRMELFEHIKAVGRPVDHAEMAQILQDQHGVATNPEAVRTSMHRLEKADGLLMRTPDRKKFFPVGTERDVSSNGTEGPGEPLARASVPGLEEVGAD